MCATRPTWRGSPTTGSCRNCRVRPARTACAWRRTRVSGPGLALLDAPDIDSVVSTNRELASTLLAAADLWVFLTTAARYADAVPWQMLHTARDRGTAIAIVLNRCPPEAIKDVSAHLSDMLAANGLGSAPLFVIAEQGLRAGRLRDKATAPIASWLAGLTADSEQRAAVVRYTLDGALRSLPPRTYALADAADEQFAARTQLESCVSSAYSSALARVDEAVRDGALLRGEVLARWQDVVGTGEFLRKLESRVGRIRDRVVAAVTGRSTPIEELGHAWRPASRPLFGPQSRRLLSCPTAAGRGTRPVHRY